MARDPRHSRQTILPEVGEAGQRRLAGARVLVVGVGGLGCPAALYLAGAGVGSLTLVDDDMVAESNLHRQVLFRTDDVGRPKVEVATQRLRDLDPALHVEARALRLDHNNVRQAVRGHDIVLDGSDNFATRYAVHDACVLEGVPLVTAAVLGFEGHCTTIRPDGPCYRCLFPQPPATALSCVDAGVLGVVPGIMGTLQATEAIKQLLGVGRSLAGRLLLYDALEGAWDEVHYGRDPDCPLCGPRPAILHPGGDTPAPPATIAWQDVEGRFLLDVREEHEVQARPIAGAACIPLGRLEANLPALPHDRPIAVCCATGVRAQAAVQVLERHGLQAAAIEGGLSSRS